MPFEEGWCACPKPIFPTSVRRGDSVKQTPKSQTRKDLSPKDVKNEGRPDYVYEN